MRSYLQSVSVKSIQEQESYIRSYPAVENMYRRYNTLLCSSAPVERLFSYAGIWSRLLGAIDLRHKTWRGSCVLRQTWICEHTACVIIVWLIIISSTSVGLWPIVLKPDYMNVIVGSITGKFCSCVQIYHLTFGWHFMSNKQYSVIYNLPVYDSHAH